MRKKLDWSNVRDFGIVLVHRKGRKLEKIVPANRSDPPGSVSDWSPKPCPAIGRKSLQVPTISISDKKPLAIYFKL